MLKRFCLFIIILIFSSPRILSAEDKTLDISVDKEEVSLNASIRLDITFPDTENMAAPQLPNIEGFEATYLRSSNIISRSDAKTLRSTRHTYVLMPQSAGIFEIGPFDVLYNGNRYISKKITVKVTSGAAEGRDQKTGLSSEARFRAKEEIFLVIEPGKDKVYINELFPITISLYYKDAHLNEIQPPVLLHEGFSLGEFRTPIKSKKSMKGYDYNVLIFNSQIFATEAGELILGPATIMCNLIGSSRADIAKSDITPEGMTKALEKYASGDIIKDIEGKTVKHPLRFESTTRTITAMPLPAEGRPDDFSGAVGNFDLAVKVEPSGYIKVGDPIKLYMEISGKGNLDMVPPPHINENENIILYEPRIKEEGDTYKIFEQVLVPNTIAFKEIPRISLSFFDPEQAAYKTVTRGNIAVTVIETYEAKKAQVIKRTEKPEVEEKQETSGRDIVYIKDSTGNIITGSPYLYKNGFFIMIQPLPLLVYISTLLLYKRYERFKNDIRYARHKIAYRKARANLVNTEALLTNNRAEDFYSSLFSAMQEYFGDKFNLPPGGITAKIVEEVLRPKGFEIGILNKVEKFFKDCDMARFTPSRYEGKDMAGIFNEAEEIVEYFKRA